jgi:hypothetical protein
MSVFLFLLGVTMMVAGLAAIYSGSLFVGIERGWTMVVSGSVGFSAGAILLGLGAALRRLKRIEKATKRLAGVFDSLPFASAGPEPENRPATPSVSSAMPIPPAPGVAPEPETAPSVAAEPAAAPAQEPPEPDKVVGTYQAGGSSYVMFADGSIRAQTPSGEHRFGSMDEFKAFMLTSAMRPRPAEPPKDEPKDGPKAQASDSPTALSAKA